MADKNINQKSFVQEEIELVNVERLVQEFVKLVSIDSISFQERKMADYLIDQLKVLGFEVEEDNAGDFYQSNTGNIYAYKKGTLEGTPILFSSHTDTVEPGLHKQAIVHKDGRITSDGTTILGADDMSGVAAILEAVRVLEEKQLEHRDLEVFLPMGEEAYLRGSEVFDYSKIKAKEGYVLDLDGEIGTAASQAPTVISFTLEILGKAAHAGFNPESGVNSIQIAAEIISRMQQGHVDFETTLNIGTIEGGKATNIVSEYCKLNGEVRSFQHEKAERQIYNLEEIAKKITSQCNGDYRLSTSVKCTAYKVDMESKAVEYLKRACKNLEYPVSFVPTFGGSDNNNMVKYGINGIVMACGMELVHSCKEYTTVDALKKSTKLLLQLMRMEE
jgi:tripeptide aminopeptidase